MTEIALYNALRKIPEVSDTEAKEAIAISQVQRKWLRKAI